MTDFGLDIYGRAVMVNPAFLRDNPDAVRKFNKATIKGFFAAFSDPEGAIESLRKYNPLAKADIVPRLTWPGAADSGVFVLTCAMPFVAFGVFGLYASMLPLFLDKMVPWHGPVVSGTAVALILFVSATFQLMVRRLPVRWCGFAGLLAIAASNALLMVNLVATSSTLFFAGVLLTALGHALTMLSGMTMINKVASDHNRSGLLSTYLVVGYLGSMLPMLGIGWIADRWGMNVALGCFCSSVVLACIVVAVLFKRHPRTAH